MRIIVPMAGMGKRMRPHTLTIPKPLLPIAGKPIVQRLVEGIANVCSEPVEEIAYVIGDFGEEVENKLIDIAADLDAKGTIYYQKEPLGTAHAVLCAKESLTGKTIVAFADTLFRAEFKLEEEKDGIIWVQKIEDPSAFGVVKVNENNIITDFVEKPKEFVSDLAIIGIYYFKDGDNLREELQGLIDSGHMKGGEFQLTDVLENMKSKGVEFAPGAVTEWLDCGNKDATVHTNQRVLEFANEKMLSEGVQNNNSTIHPPCYIGKNVVLENSEIGPHVSIGDNTTVKNSVMQNCIVQTNTQIENAKLENSMIGNFVEYKGNNALNEVSIGDYSTIKSK